jgi:hypothetical protein
VAFVGEDITDARLEGLDAGVKGVRFASSSGWSIRRRRT